jgi:hypothetical protein
MTYDGIHFKFATLRSELSNLAKMAKPYLERDCRGFLDDCLSDLQSIESSQHTEEKPWQIRETSPLRTVLTDGYELGCRGGDMVWGELCFVWGVKRVSTTDQVTRKHLCLSGNASTKISICRKVDGQRKVLVQWQIEVGAANSPGWHFHVGIGGGFPVPRVPGMLVLPTDGLDFLLGELFQDAWRAKVSKDSPETQVVGNFQVDRLDRWCKWQAEQIHMSHGSCWSRLKYAKPPKEIFLL